jgi:hypothetical protein
MQIMDWSPQLFPIGRSFGFTRQKASFCKSADGFLCCTSTIVRAQYFPLSFQDILIPWFIHALQRGVLFLSGVSRSEFSVFQQLEDGSAKRDGPVQKKKEGRPIWSDWAGLWLITHQPFLSAPTSQHTPQQQQQQFASTNPTYCISMMMMITTRRQIVDNKFARSDETLFSH